MNRILAFLLLSALVVFAQGNLGRIEGTVTDPTGAAVPGADISLKAVATSQIFITSTDERGTYAVPQLAAGAYQLTVTKTGFVVANVTNIVLSAGVPASVPVKLEVGKSTESVTVEAGAEVLQTQSAELSNTVTGRQITELPFATRNAVELMVTQPGTSTPTNPRSSTINGLPKGSINITIDGMNTQDNLLKSSDGFFSYIMPSVDSLEEVTLTTSAGGVDSTAQGAAQIKFVTKSGTNQYHGGAFLQERNTFFDANFFFNNQTGLPRDVIHLRQMGLHLGGPIIANKLFFFGNYEAYRNPGTKAYSKNVPVLPYTQGLYTYQDSAGGMHTVNLLTIAAAANATLPSTTRQYPTTVDPIVAQTYAQVLKLTSSGNLKSNAGSNDYNSMSYSYQPAGSDKRDFWTARFDYNLSQKHHLSYTYDYDKYVSVPDFLNNIVPVYEGTGAVLGTDSVTGQRSNRFVGTLSLRSSLTSRLSNELRGGLNGGTVLFFDSINDGLFAQWKGFSPGITNASITTTRNPQRRNGPYQEIGDTVTWGRGQHQISAGGTWSKVKMWQKYVSSESIPAIAFGTTTGDPLITGTAAPFVQGPNFPGATSSQVSSMASAYANLVGRVSSITRQVVQDENTHQYVSNSPATDRNSSQWWGFFGQDAWRVAPSLTITVGLRWEKEGNWVNDNQTYTAVTNASLYGISGIGNLFKPGTFNGTVPTYDKLTDDNTYHMPAVFAPSIGLAWQVPSSEGPLGILLGRHQGASVLRGGYSISTVREGSNLYTSIYGANQGLTQDASISPTTYPADFGPAGSVLFRDATLPQRSGLQTAPVFPIPASFTASLNGFDQNLKMGYVQSWNIGWQRELSHNTVVEFRMTGNHELKGWRQLNLNEVNIMENGFLKMFNDARQNLNIARGGNILNTSLTNNFGNQGMPGQVAIPFIQSMLGSSCCTDATTAGYLTLGQAGSMANAAATNQTRYTNMTNAGYDKNFFLVNPTVGGGGSYIVKNYGSSYYDAGQLELRRRMAAGLMIQGSYVWSKALANGATANSIVYSQPTTLRNLALNKGPSGFDIRHAIKANYLWEFPVGPGRRFFSSVQSPVVRKALEGWETAGTVRLQSGNPFSFGSFSTFNQNGNGVTFNNITLQQIQDSVSYRKGQNPVTGLPAVYMFPFPIATSGLTAANNTNFITNTQAAFQQNNLTPAQVNATSPYVGFAGPGGMGCIMCFIHLPWQRYFDVSVVKITHITERVNVEFRAQAINVFNLTNFNAGAGIGSTFGLVTGAYQDISGQVNPGGRILEFVARVNF